MQYHLHKLRTAACKTMLIWVERKTPNRKVAYREQGMGVGVGIEGSQ